jgi:1-acyl-sn-glycerol-3-phosphate acyltransferase
VSGEGPAAEQAETDGRDAPAAAPAAGAARDPRSRRYGRKGRQGSPSKLVYRVVRDVLVGFGRAYHRLGVEGTERLPASGSYVVAPVHRSYLDFFLVAAIRRPRMRYMGKDSLWRVHPAISWFMDALGGYAVARGAAADRDALNTTIGIVEEGREPVVLFPEGARQTGPTIKPLYDGVAYVATRCQVPIVPVGIGGSEAAMPKGARFPRPHRIRLVVGEPIAPPPLGPTGRVSRKAVKALSDQLAEELQRAFDEAQRAAGIPQVGPGPA